MRSRFAFLIAVTLFCAGISCFGGIDLPHCALAQALTGAGIRASSSGGTPVTINTVYNYGESSPETSLSYNFNFSPTSGGNTLLAVLQGDGSTSFPTAISCTWNSVSLTQIGTTVTNGSAGTNGVWNAFFGLVGSATGSNTFACTWTGTTRISTTLIALNSVLQTSVATAFINFNSATGSDATAGANVTITDGSAKPASNLDFAAVNWQGGSTASVNGMSYVGSGFFPVAGNSDVYSVGSATGAASATIGATGGLVRVWTTIGLTAVAASP